MTDIVERLRKHDDDETSLKTESLLREAADEIERLRSETEAYDKGERSAWVTLQDYMELEREVARLREQADDLRRVNQAAHSPRDEASSA